MFILGKDQEEAIAKEGALKMKEIPYIHAEGYSSSALKHGPFALIEKNLPIILLDVCETYRDKTRNAFQEILAREANVIRISSDVSNADLLCDKNNTFGGVVANVYIQLMSYFLAVSQNIDPDFPRNLAKVVTVE
jgi:glucosamine--fructose-6-phosphate aminotransferase (isomerizing)